MFITKFFHHNGLQTTQRGKKCVASVGSFIVLKKEASGMEKKKKE